MKKNDIKNSADLFLYKAIIDFNTAKAIFKSFENDDIEIYIEKIYFDLQQSSEKLLKNLLSKNGVDVPKIHDIKQLIRVCEKNNINLMSRVEVLIDLSDYAVEGRYDIICDDISNSDLYFELVEQFIIFVKGDKA
ncbi:MAG: HEPN domain-containing protein [Campylobacterota bacterium]|nr:HEPN domain-containing protein [Campylobacterota bacterium]